CDVINARHIRCGWRHPNSVCFDLVARAETSIVLIFRNIFILQEVSNGHPQCQHGGAADSHSGHQPGHGCAEAGRGAAPAVGDAARILLRTAEHL
ncbi:hypothetical protein ANANG_G00197820, partial [Anguilla anguilla]